MKIAIDIDGVVADIMAPIKKICSDFGFSPCGDKHLLEIEGLDDDGAFIRKTIDTILESQMHSVKPYHGAASAIESLSNHCGAITFVTARREQFMAETTRWLERYLNISFGLAHKGSSEKTDFLLENGFDVFIEDRLRTASLAAEAGILTFLVNRPWNTGRMTHRDVIRVNKLSSVQFSLLGQPQQHGPKKWERGVLNNQTERSEHAI